MSGIGGGSPGDGGIFGPSSGEIKRAVRQELNSGGKVSDSKLYGDGIEMNKQRAEFGIQGVDVAVQSTLQRIAIAGNAEVGKAPAKDYYKRKHYLKQLGEIRQKLLREAEMLEHAIGSLEEFYKHYDRG